MYDKGFCIDLKCNKQGGVMDTTKYTKESDVNKNLYSKVNHFGLGFNRSCQRKVLKSIQNLKKIFIIIFQSVIELIATQTDSCLNFETGGELFGFFSHDGNMIIMLATPPGKNAKHSVTSFQQDILFFKRISKKLYCKFGLQFLGNWHSHHFLHLKHLSNLDRKNLNTIAKNNNFKNLCQFLLTFENTNRKDQERFIRLQAYFYHDATGGEPEKCPIRIIQDVSPFEEVIANDPDLMEIKNSYRFPLSRLIYDEYQHNSYKNSSIPEIIQFQLVEFMENHKRSSASITIRQNWIIIKISIPNETGFIFIVYEGNDPFDIKAIFYQAELISKDPVNITHEIFENNPYSTISLNIVYEIAQKLIANKNFTAKKEEAYL